MRINFKITGLILLLALTSYAPAANAMYSPKISESIGEIRQHMFEARQLNATGSVRHGIQKIFDEPTVQKLNQADDQARAANQGTSLPAPFHQLRADAKNNVSKDAFNNFLEPFMILFNRLPVKHQDGSTEWQSITSCLRNDIFQLETMEDSVKREALQSSLKLNSLHATILWDDYKTLRTILQLLKTEYKNTNLFFGTGLPNYYEGANCPEGGFFGEYGRAFDDLKRSWDTFSTMAFGGGLGQSTSNGQWGSIKEMAIARAKVRATQWIRANQITLSIGGPEGGDPLNITGLMRQEGFGGVANLFKTQWQIAKGLLGISAAFYGDAKGPITRSGERTAKTIAEDLQGRLNERDTHLIQAETSIKFNLQFSNLTDTNTLEIDRQLGDINAEIRRATEQFGARAGKALPTLCNDLRSILLKHCPNKGGDIPACR